MSIEVVKDAFIEGRYTETSWADSEAKSNQIKLDVFTANNSNFKKETASSAIPLQRIDPSTGKVLGVYPSRISAARWIAEHVLKHDPSSPSFHKKALAITGNIFMCMASGFKSYGFYWKKATIEELENNPVPSKNSKGIPVWVKSAHGFGFIVNSMTAAAKIAGVGDKKLKSLLFEEGVIGVSLNRHVFQKVNTVDTLVTFDSLEDASKITGLGIVFLKRIVGSGERVNGYEYNISGMVPNKEYRIFLDKKAVTSKGTIEEIKAELNDLGLSENAVVSVANTSVRLKNIYRVVSYPSITEKKTPQSKSKVK